jgi:hypothetical protein
LEPAKPTPKASTFFDGFMGALVGVGAVELFHHLTDQKHSPGRTVATVLSLLFFVGGLIGIVYSRTKHRK